MYLLTKHRWLDPNEPADNARLVEGFNVRPARLTFFTLCPHVLEHAPLARAWDMLPFNRRACFPSLGLTRLQLHPWFCDASGRA